MLSPSRELARLEGGVGDSGVLICLPILRRLAMSLTGSLSDSSSTSDLARESRNTSIIALAGLASRVLRGFLGEYNGERNVGREEFEFEMASSGRKGERPAMGDGASS